MFLEIEEIINSLIKEEKDEKGLKNRILYTNAIKALTELKERKERM